MKRLDYENPREKKNGAYANELLRGELQGQTAVVGVRFSPRASLSTSSCPSPNCLLPCPSNKLLVIYSPIIPQNTSSMNISQLIRSTLDAIPWPDPTATPWTFSTFRLATRLLLPSLYSRRAYRLVDNVAILKSASGVVGIEKVVGEMVKTGRWVYLFVVIFCVIRRRANLSPFCTRGRKCNKVHIICWREYKY